MSTTPTRAPSTPTISPQRRLLVDQARQSWIRKLIDLSRRNNLLYFRPLNTGTLDLSNADQENMAAFLRGEEGSFLRCQSWVSRIRLYSRPVSLHDGVRTDWEGFTKLGS